MTHHLVVVLQVIIDAPGQVFKTSSRGWGLRTLVDMPGGAFVCTYVGNLYESEEANTVGRNFGDEYFAELDLVENVERHKEGYESEVVEPEQEGEVVETGTVEEGKGLQEEAMEAGVRRSSRLVVVAKKPQKTKAKKAKAKKVRRRPVVSIRKLFGAKEEAYIMDAKTTGNIGRYMNHSCHPNVFVQNVFVDSHDLR